MSTALITELSTHTLTVLVGRRLAATDEVLEALAAGGIEIHQWKLSSTDLPCKSRLTVDFEGDVDRVRTVLRCHGLSEHEIHGAEEAASLELAVVRVRASGKVQDEAAAIVGAAGGRLLTFDDHGFTAQISHRPARIEEILAQLRAIAPLDVVRSGRVSFGSI